MEIKAVVNEVVCACFSTAFIILLNVKIIQKYKKMVYNKMILAYNNDKLKRLRGKDANSIMKEKSGMEEKTDEEKYLVALKEYLKNAIKATEAINGTQMEIDVESRLFDPKLDFAFKSMFTQKTAESNFALRSFLSSILGITVNSVEITNNEIAVSNLLEKQSSMDIHIKFESDEEANIEMQMKSIDNIINRAEYSVCKLFSSQLIKGMQYRNLVKVYEIMIINFTLFPDCTDFISEYDYRNEKGWSMSGNTKIYFIELTKLKNILKKPVNAMSSTECWALFLKYANNKNQRKLIAKIMEKEEGVKMAVNVLEKISEDRAEQIRYFTQLKYEIEQEYDRRLKEELKADEKRVREMKEHFRVEQEQMEAEQERVKAEQERVKAEQEQVKAEQEQVKAEQEQVKAEQEQVKAEREQMEAEKVQIDQSREVLLHMAKDLIGLGASIDEIAEKTRLSKDKIEKN